MFLIILEAVFETHGYPAERIFSVDETGLTTIQSKFPQVVRRKTNVKQVH
jgi:hypothetical protein